MKIFSRRKLDPRKKDTGPFYITTEGLVRLEEQLAHLKKVLPGYIAETARTAAYGDRSDNAEYKDAKATLRRTNYRILELEDQLKRVEIIKSSSGSAGEVQLGSTVVLKTGQAKKTFQIVGPHETNPSEGRISHQSPLGSALLGHKKDDSVKVKTASGYVEYAILEIR